MSAYRNQIAILVLVLGSWLPKNGMAAPVRRVAAKPPTPKSFAVFSASYNAKGDLVRGGVCGTLFFLSPSKGITAFHVLQPVSFQPLRGFEKVRVWLVHENYRPIEIKAKYLAYDRLRDLTVVHLPADLQVDKKFVYSTGWMPTIHTRVETEGFVANTDGPILARVGTEVTVTAVPKLVRLHLSGQMLQQAQINLEVTDIHLTAAPEFRLSYKPVVGISGGPVLAHGRVIAMNSFADPAGFKSTWALQLVSGPARVAGLP